MTDPSSNWHRHPGTTSQHRSYVVATPGTTETTNRRSGDNNNDDPTAPYFNMNDGNHNTTTDNEAYSPFLNNLLRFSPKQHPSSLMGHHSNIYQASPLHYRRPPTTATNSTPATSTSTTTVAATIPSLPSSSPSTIVPKNNHGNNNNATTIMLDDEHINQPKGSNTYVDDDDAVQDGIPIHHLRALVQSTLHQSPNTASYYANIIYCKTQSLHDAYILAQAHYYNHKYDTCLRIIEESQLLQWQNYYPSIVDDNSTNHGRYDTSISQKIVETSCSYLLWDTVLVASQALLAKRDYTTLIDLLEDTCRLPSSGTVATNTTTTIHPVSNTTDDDHPWPPPPPLLQSLPLEDNDPIGWMTLKRIITTTSSSTTNTTATGTIKLHPLSLICYYRGVGYYETGCTIRAMTYWKWSLVMDSYNQIAWRSLLENHLLTNVEAYEFLMHDDRFIFQHPEQDWLKSIYLSSIEFNSSTTPTQSKRSDLPTDGVISSTVAGTADTTTVTKPSTIIPQHENNSLAGVSSIHFSALSPIPTFHVPDTEISTVMEKSTTNDDNKDDDEQQQQNMDTITESSRTTTAQNDIDRAFYNLFHVYKLQNSSQVLAVAARRAYRQYDWKSSLLYCQDLAQLDPTVEEAAFYYIATLVMLGHKRVLFRLAHEWVDATPKAARSWFAVGAYYYSIHRYHIAQRHFSRATRVNPQCTEAWIALGCAFAACDESDQALASYRAAQRLSPGEHSSLLYMGMEYIRTNHLVLASHFLQAAVSSSGSDPLCLHEMGVLAAHKGEHKDAIFYFRQAMSLIGNRSESLQEIIDLCDNVYWEPTIFNLGHSYRKSRQFSNAIICFKRCVTLCPEKYSAYSALAFTKHLMSDIDDAISNYHKALGLKPDDPFCTDMLSRAFHDQIATATTHDIFSVGLQSTTNNATDPKFLSTPNFAFGGHKKGDSATGEDMELDFEMSITS